MNLDTEARDRAPRGYLSALTPGPTHPHTGRRRTRPLTDHRDDPMLVAVRSFRAMYAGRLVTITAGADRACASHPLVTQNPDAWERLR